MTTMNEISAATIEQALMPYISADKVSEWIGKNMKPYRELLSYYRCAIMEVETKFRVLNEDFTVGECNNPIESIKTRLKSPKSIVEKMIRLNFPLTVESIEENMHDIAGVRVICSTVSDIYLLADALLSQDDILLIEKKDYFAHPKSNGYRSLHLIVSTPIFLHNEKRMMKVEVQLRTLAMDAWASLEHKIRYKKQACSNQPEIDMELLKCADLCAEFDGRIHKIIQKE